MKSLIERLSNPRNRLVRCFDSEGKAADRYTVVFLKNKERWTSDGWLYGCLAMNGWPFHPQGFCQHSTAVLGRHLGKKIPFTSLPLDCQKAVFMDLN